ncbi:MULTISPECIES: methylenetetrahydrofolate reductase [NAD(P)H] [Marinobacter]|uniref:Methylenetetrahydrofolate reductase n=1 Tax=Marinobacter xestospongiae TaxID=994319 RepID=A0ABU3W2B4_9GAMM|nr:MULTISPECIES: methylenetetrahydrofolate reductase [NAD(P)H] [Marinobacter]MCG8519882.1 methylenetetrahydrofolate reductase [NAD(P)H] [Pseudomonadales bacterium]MCK7565284.1 methylenetetrahydrofolate reductase [NAD(P)H] [Marinobacter xestospongiae]MDV2080136.1 methylenetetrahydrofolate reductase [NAD(P)H] [Marinobacter xestospongiae]UDL06060.1 methylenetetrahydrofolate reductase [NAD(P)H] [Marinobacter sp. CA1]
MQSQKQFKRRFSFEFFPPKTDQGREKLQLVRNRLAEVNPDFFSVTFGAGGSTRDRTIETVLNLHKQGISTAPHLSCVGGTREEIGELLDLYRENGINRIVALRGDLPSGMGASGELRYANDLVAFIREHSGDHFNLEVAAYPEFHPQARNAEEDLKNFARKVQAGANSAITQYFFNADSYFYFIDRLEKMDVTIPVVPGIMPIVNFSSLVRFSDMCGAEIPRWIRKQLEAYGDDTTSIRKFGEEVVTEMCQKLLDAGAPGLHFYTLNQAEASLNIWNNLGLADRDKISF